MTITPVNKFAILLDGVNAVVSLIPDKPQRTSRDSDEKPEDKDEKDKKNSLPMGQSIK